MNVTPSWVNCAFAHKGGMHIDAVNKAASSFEHIDPELVGGSAPLPDERSFGSQHDSGQDQGTSTPASPRTTRWTDSIMKRLKEMEHEGYQFEGAESTFELVIRKQLGKYRPFFELEHFKIIGEQPANGEYSSSAIIKVKSGRQGRNHGGRRRRAGACARSGRCAKFWTVFYPELSNVHLTDYKVRVINGRDATAAKVRVLLQSTDGDSVWTTVGVSTDIIEASWIALVDSIEFKLLRLEDAKATSRATAKAC